MKAQTHATKKHRGSLGQNPYQRSRAEGFRAAGAGFSLIELLVVMAVAVLLISLSGVAFTQIAMGSRLDRAGQTVEDQITLAQQEALTRNRRVEVRFLQIAGAAGQQWRGIQVLRLEENGTLTPISKISALPDGTGLSATQASSPLLFPPSPTASSPYTAITGNCATAAYGNVAYRAFRFLPNGALAGAPGSNNYLTLQNSAATGNPPANYYAVQVNPVTGKVTSYRP